MCTTAKCRITISMLKATMQLNICTTLCRGTIQWHLCAACECQTVIFCFLLHSLDLRRNSPQKLCSAKIQTYSLQWLETLGVRGKKSTCYVTFSQIRNFFWDQHLCISFLFLELYLIFQQPTLDYFEHAKQSLVESHLGSEYSGKGFLREMIFKKITISCREINSKSWTSHQYTNFDTAFRTDTHKPS